MEYFEDILTIIGLFFMPFVMVIFISLFKNKTKSKRYQLQADLMAKAIESGQTLPENFFDEPKKQKQDGVLRTGICLIAAGVGTTLCVWLMDLHLNQAMAMGIIPFLIGVAFLIIHFIEKKKPTDENAK